MRTKRAWTTKQGKRLVPEEMSTTHLWNSLRVLELGGQELLADMKKATERPGLVEELLLLRDRAVFAMEMREEMLRELSKRPSVEDINALVTYKRVFSPLTGQKPAR